MYSTITANVHAYITVRVTTTAGTTAPTMGLYRTSVRYADDFYVTPVSNFQSPIPAPKNKPWFGIYAVRSIVAATQETEPRSYYRMQRIQERYPPVQRMKRKRRASLIKLKQTKP